MQVQPRKTINELAAIIRDVEFMDRNIRIGEMGSGYFIQVQYVEKDIVTGELELQKARKWYVSPYSTDTEIVESAFAACCRSMMHVAKEHFIYKGHRVYSPHFDIETRLEICAKGKFDKRIPLPGEPE